MVRQTDSDIDQNKERERWLLSLTLYLDSVFYWFELAFAKEEKRQVFERFKKYLF